MATCVETAAEGRSVPRLFYGVVQLPSSDSKNVLASAFVDPPAPVSAAQLRHRAAELKERYDLPFVKWVHALQQANPPDAQTSFR